MAGTISFGGIASNMDTEGIVTGLVNASSGQLNKMKTQATETDSAVSTLSSISTLLSTLQRSVDALASTTSVGSYSGSSSSTAIAVSTTGNAQPGSYSIDVKKLAREQRNYSSAVSSSSEALSHSGTLGIKVGSGDQVDIAISATDTLDDIAGKINASGARISAAIFNDGSNYRLQIRGLDTGEANAVTFNESGFSLGLNLPESKVQAAQDSEIKIDGFTVKRSTNQVVGALQGVTLALTQETTSPVTVSVQSDPSSLQKKLQSVVDGYNAVITKIHQVAGYGSTKGTVAALQGDSALRSISQRLASAVQTRVSGAGTNDTLGSLGLSLTRDGMLSLDGSKLATALNKDANSVAAVLAGPSGGSGVMDIISDLAKGVTRSDGQLTLRQDALTSRADLLRKRADAEKDRLDRYADGLRKQFTQMDGAVAAYNAQSNYLTAFNK
ncbi:MAG TPA: flagellar filament capping protein FliD [Polyangiaceae bacterium]|nr:flagellar filament capping protein FliD [Polyangiaceae bacterium]